MCAMTDVCVAAVPAVRITRGFVTDRFMRRMKSTHRPELPSQPCQQQSKEHHNGTDQRAANRRDNSHTHRTKLTGDARQLSLSMLSP